MKATSAVWAGGRPRGRVRVGYTIFSEWLNIVVRKSWQYSELMPVVPFIDTDLSPLLQWIIIPNLGLWWARQADREAADRR